MSLSVGGPPALLRVLLRALQHLLPGALVEKIIFLSLNGLLFCSVVDLDGSGLEFFLGSGSSKIGKEQKNKNFIYILGLWIRDCSTV